MQPTEAGSPYEAARQPPKRTGGRVSGQPVDISPQPVRSPVHSLCITAGDDVRCALTTSDFTVPTVWRKEKSPRCGGKSPVVTKPSPQGVAVRSNSGHAFLVDQREWDYGARLPRESRAPESWSSSASPEDPEKPWGSVTDTGSWSPVRRPPPGPSVPTRGRSVGPENEQGGQLVGAGCHRPARFPADGVGWRTETAEWRATEQTARWRQTTEWRSTSGTHGWRSTTEAWQTGSGAEGFLPSVDPPVREQLAISGTAWPTPSDDEQPVEPVETGQVWQQPVDNPPAPNGSTQQVAWQRFGESTPPWQQEARPSWQQFAAPPAPWEQSSAASQPPWQPAPTERPRSWQTPTESPQSPPWQQHLIEPSAAGRASGDALLAAGTPDVAVAGGRSDGHCHSAAHRPHDVLQQPFRWVRRRTPPGPRG